MASAALQTEDVTVILMDDKVFVPHICYIRISRLSLVWRAPRLTLIIGFSADAVHWSVLRSGIV